jgi:hypothetical protein
LSEVEIFSLGAASCRDGRGCSPLPQGRHFIADRTAQRAVTRFLRRLQNWQNEMNLERKVDLNTRCFLSKYYRERILPEAEVQYDAA